jgi:hypothetical protein
MKVELKGDELRRKVEKIKAEHRELNKLIPLHPIKRRKQVAKSELWNREQRQELSRLAEAFLKARSRSDVRETRNEGERK